MLPGNTVLPAEETGAPVMTPLSLPVGGRPVVVFATNEINDTNLFINGLTQNIVILYHLLESLGWEAYLLQHSVTASDKKEFLKRYRYVNTQDIVMRQMNIKLFMEIGMSLDPVTRGYLRSIGTKMVKLYLGNILNIDVETIQNYSNMFFNHHIVDQLDEIWTSPHYAQHVEYAAVLNRVAVEKGVVVPYVWEPCFLLHYGTRAEMEWEPPASWETMDMVIMDPNISFQKCSFYSLLLAEAFAKAYPAWRGVVHVVNGDRLKLSSHARNHLLPALTLFQTDRIRLYERKKIHEVLREHRSACFLTHQWNNAYNYMTLELFYTNYPIVHNSDGWEAYGYHYSLEDWTGAVENVRRAMQDHARNLPIYATHAANLIWKHSPHHPDIQRRWLEIIKS